MTCTVAVINWNSGAHLRACLDSLVKTTDTHILVIDNASADHSEECAYAFKDRVQVVRNSVNRGFAGGVNQAFAATSEPFVLILNPDVCARPGAVQALETFMQTHPRSAAAGGNVNAKYLPRPFPTPMSVVRENLGFPVRSKLPADDGAVAVDQPAASAMMIRRAAFEAVRGFDESFYPAWYEDVDFCRRLNRAGWKLHFVSGAQFQHEGGYSAVTLGRRAFAEAYYRNQLRYARKHFGTPGRTAIRISIAMGMIMRMAARPHSASACFGVLRGALKAW